MVRTAKHFERYQRCCCCRYQCCEFVDRSVLLVGPWCWWDSGSGKTLWKISTPRPAWSWSAAINSTQERRNADIGLFAKSARDEHEHHKLNTKAQMGTKTKTTKIQWNRQMEDKDQKDMGKFPDFFFLFFIAIWYILVKRLYVVLSRLKAAPKENLKENSLILTFAIFCLFGGDGPYHNRFHNFVMTLSLCAQYSLSPRYWIYNPPS